MATRKKDITCELVFSLIIYGFQLYINDAICDAWIPAQKTEYNYIYSNRVGLEKVIPHCLHLLEASCNGVGHR